MATFKLGAFVTDITGSIGGTTFKRGAGNKIILNKTRGASRTKLLKNPALQRNASIFQQFSLLAESVKAEWATVALNFEFPDKYGVPRNLTARQIFNKLHLQLATATQTPIEPATVTSTVPPISELNFDVARNLSLAEIQVSFTGASIWILVQIEVSSNRNKTPTFTRRAYLIQQLANDGAGFDISEFLNNQYGYLNENYLLRIYVTLMNESGFRGPTIFKNANWYTV